MAKLKASEKYPSLTEFIGSSNRYSPLKAIKTGLSSIRLCLSGNLNLLKLRCCELDLEEVIFAPLTLNMITLPEIAVQTRCIQGHKSSTKTITLTM